jgi:SAM-dependent methyltransferase
MSISKDKIKEQYQKKFKKFGINPKSLFWGSKGAAHQRFRQMWAEIDFNNKSVLDVGCGFGEMAKFLLKRYKGVKYTGVDIVPEFAEEAGKLFPQQQFLTLDYFSEPLSEKFDVILASGTLNSNVENNLEYRKKAIKVMFDHTKKVLAFNMLGGHPQPENNEDNNIWHADSLEILEYCMTLTRRVVLRADYHPRDFTIFMYPAKKKSFIKRFRKSE